MKRIFTFLLVVMTAAPLLAQVPGAMSYQAVVRDNNNTLIINSTVGLRVSILQGIKPVYEETFFPVTNANGLLTVEIGSGEGFGSINWADGPYFIKTEIDPAGGTHYSITGISQMLSVPYAFHARTASYLTGDDGKVLKSSSAGVPSQTWSLFGNAKSNPAKDKLGTTDPSALVIVTNDEERMRINQTGELIVRQNAQFDKNVNVDGITKTDKLIVEDPKGDTYPDVLPRYGSIADVRGFLYADSIAVRGGLDIGGSLKVHGDSVIADHHLLVKENAFVRGLVKIDGPTTINNISNLNGQVTISASLTGGDASYGAYPLRVQGSDQGIAIKVNNAKPDGSNNYITFFDGSGGAVGRVEGQTYDEKLNSPDYIYNTAAKSATELEKIAAQALALEPIPVAVVAAVCTPCALMAAADLILASADLASYEAFALTNLGVTYASGSADYAEWLERSDPGEPISAGDIVGVNGGKISKYTRNAKQFMVVSTKPAMLGNMPRPGMESLYEKVAFMGQIPVRVRGVVLTGDYILPSGLNDGTGIAVSAEDITAEQYRSIVGVAWSNGMNHKGISVVNMAIGLNANDVADIAVKQDRKIKELEKRLMALEKKSVNATESAPVAQQAEVQKITRGEMLASYMPAELSNEIMEEAMTNLENTLRDKGINVKDNPVFSRLFTDVTYRAEVIKRAQESYRLSYQHIVNETKN